MLFIYRKVNKNSNSGKTGNYGTNRGMMGQALTADHEIAMLEQEEGQIVADRIGEDVIT